MRGRKHHNWFLLLPVKNKGIVWPSFYWFCQWSNHSVPSFAAMLNYMNSGTKNHRLYESHRGVRLIPNMTWNQCAVRINFDQRSLHSPQENLFFPLKCLNPRLVSFSFSASLRMSVTCMTRRTAYLHKSELFLSRILPHLPVAQWHLGVMSDVHCGREPESKSSIRAGLQQL